MVYSLYVLTSISISFKSLIYVSNFLFLMIFLRSHSFITFSICLLFTFFYYLRILLVIVFYKVFYLFLSFSLRPMNFSNRFTVYVLLSLVSYFSLLYLMFIILTFLLIVISRISDIL